MNVLDYLARKWANYHVFRGKLTKYMAEKKNSKIKRVVLPAVVLGTSVYYSFAFTGGIVLGYLLSKAFCNVFWKTGKIESVFLDFGKWELHLHHWIMGLLFLALVWVIDFFYLPAFFAGVVVGVILQDIYDYNDWHQVIIKKD